MPGHHIQSSRSQATAIACQEIGDLSGSQLAKNHLLMHTVGMMGVYIFFTSEQLLDSQL